MQGKVLLADNDPDFLDTRAEFLEQAGYRVLEAYTLEKARQLLDEAHVHLAVLDIRMEDDDDERDISGLTLAKDPDFRAVPKIILTGFPTYQAAREALGPALASLSPAVDFLAKHEGPEALIQALERAFAQHVRINWNLKIRWGEKPSPALVSLIEPELPAERIPGRVEEMEDLLRKLFYDFEQVVLGQTLLGLAGQSLFLEAFAYSPNTAGALSPREFIVHCGRPGPIHREEERFRRIPQSVAPFLLRRELRAETRHYAATAGSLLEGDLENILPFDSFYRQRSTEDVLSALDNFLENPLASWHEQGRFPSEKPLLNLWQEGLLERGERLSPEEMSGRLEGLCRESLAAGLGHIECAPNRWSFSLAGDTVQTLNPLIYLDEKHAPAPQPVLCGSIHGRPDASRILVGLQGRTWLLDLSWAASGPLVRDFAVLENSIKFDLVDAAGPPEWLELERRLLRAKSLGEPILAEDFSLSLQKAARAIERVRCQAARTLGEASNPYLLGLLYEALERIARYDPQVRHTSREIRPYMHALLSAALIGDALSSLPEAPREDFWLDEENREAWVEGRRIPLTEQEFKVLRYLYHHRGRLCRRRAIVEEALGEHCEDSLQERDRLTSLMSRLREKIEQPPVQKRYLHTVRAAGYKLEF